MVVTRSTLSTMNDLEVTTLFSLPFAELAEAFLLWFDSSLTASLSSFHSSPFWPMVVVRLTTSADSSMVLPKKMVVRPRRRWDNSLVSLFCLFISSFLLDTVFLPSPGGVLLGDVVPAPESCLALFCIGNRASPLLYQLCFSDLSYVLTLSYLLFEACC